MDELIRRTSGAHPISSVDELHSDAFETDEELDEFLAFVTESRTRTNQQYGNSGDFTMR